MRRQMGIARPNIGPLTDRMLLNSGDAVHERLVQPRVEPEIGLRLQTALDARHAPVDRHTVVAAVEGAYACLEVVHSTWTGYRFNLEQNTADNSSAGQVVVGPRLPVTDLMAAGTVAVRLHDGSHHTLGQGVGADADGHPLDAVARLARELVAFSGTPSACASDMSPGKAQAANINTALLANTVFVFGGIGNFIFDVRLVATTATSTHA